jgi:hypothetical protein
MPSREITQKTHQQRHFVTPLMFCADRPERYVTPEEDNEQAPYA